MEKTTSKRIVFFVSFSVIFLIVILSFFSLQEKKILAENSKKIAEEQLKIEQAEKKLYLLGEFSAKDRDDFTLVSTDYTVDPTKSAIYLRTEALDAFIQMHNKAKSNGILLKIGSGTRNFNEQKSLWNRRWSGAELTEGKDLSKSAPEGKERFQKLLEYTAVPGTSRHHWGTEIDINDANVVYFEKKSGRDTYEWLKENAMDFGFCQTYNEKTNRPLGYNEEKWHWSYIPLAKKFTDDYVELIRKEDIKGFSGDKYATDLNLIEENVLNINPDCIQ